MRVYVAFDADNDFWAYKFMRGWASAEWVDFGFDDVHKERPIPDGMAEAPTKRRLEKRMLGSDAVVLLIGESTRYLYRYVRWELELALSLDLPIIAANLNRLRTMDTDLCPPIIRDEYVVHVAYKARIINHALESFPAEFARRAPSARGPRWYSRSVYRALGIGDDD